MNTEALTAAAHTIYKAGGPKFPEWCDIEHMTIANVGSSNKMRCSPGTVVHCPPACEAEVIAYAGKVRAWWLRKGYWSDVCPDEGTEQWETVVDCDNPLERGRFVNYFDTQLAASVALIEAVAGEVGND